MDPTVIVAIITALSSITVAIIQAYSTITQLKMSNMQEPEHSQSSNKTSEVQISEVGEPVAKSTQKVNQPNYSVWWYASGIVIISSVVVPLMIGDDNASLPFLLIIIPITALTLSFLKPIYWSYAAFFVTLLDAGALLGTFLVYPDFSLGQIELRVLSMAYIPTVLISSLIAYFRLYKDSKKSQ